MDRILLKKEDVKMIFEWSELNKNLVRLLPAPLKSVEIHFENNNWQIKGIREESLLKIYISYSGNKMGKLEFEIKENNLLVLKKGNTKLTQDSFNKMLNCYCGLMAFMVYEKPEIVKSDKTRVERKDKYKRGKIARKHITYILRKRTVVSGKDSVGHHASPKGVFTVRGHYRYYKSGKRIWISEYKKGVGNKKSKTYKIGGKKID